MASKSQTGIRWIDGQEYMLSGRYSDQQRAIDTAKYLRKSWLKVRVIKLWEFDFLIYVHGAKSI